MTLSRVAFTLLCLVTAYVVLGRIFIPLAEQSRAQLELAFSDMSGHEVRIGSLEGQWRGFSPYLAIQDLSLSVQSTADIAGGVVGTNEYGVENVAVTLNMPRSLFSWQWVIGNIEVEGLSLRIRESESGEWLIDGFAGGGGEGKYNELLMDVFLNIELLNLSDTTLVLENRFGETVTVHEVSATLKNRNDLHELSMKFSLPGQESRLSLAFSSQGDLRNNPQGNVYLEFNELELAPLISLFLSPEGVRPETFVSSGEIWMSLGSDRQSLIQAELDDLSLSMTVDDNLPLQVSDFSGRITLQGRQDESWQLWMQDVAMRSGEDSLQSELYYTRYIPSGPGLLDFQGDQIDLALLTGMLLVADVLPDQAVDVISGLSPSGVLKDIRLHTPLDGSAAELFRLHAILDRVSVNAFGGAPAGSGITGELSASGNRGQVTFESSDLGIFLPTLFDNGWEFSRAEGAVRWGEKDGAVRVVSNAIKVSNETLSGSVQFELLNQLSSMQEQVSDFTLLVGIDRFDASMKTAYLPSTLSGIRDTMNWLDDSIISGEVYDSGLIYRGSAKKEAVNAKKSFQAVFRVRDGELAFLQNWPVLEEVNAEVVVNNTETDVLATSAETAGISLADVSASVRPDPGRKGAWLNISGSGSSGSAVGLSYLHDSPVIDGMRNTIAGWTAEGELDISLDLQIPLGEGAQELKQQVDVLVTSHDTDLYMQEQSLTFSDLNGDILFSTDSGLQAEKLQATLFGHPLVTDIETFTTNTLGETATRITSTGQADVNALRDWPGQSDFVRNLLSFAEGNIGIQSVLSMFQPASGVDNSLQLSIDTTDVSMELPSPLGKNKGVSRPLDVQIDFQPGGDQVRVFYESILSAQLQLEEGAGFSEGLLVLGSAIELTDENGVPFIGSNSTDGLTVKGDMPFFEYEEWREIAEAFSNNQEGGAGVVDSISEIELNIGRLGVMGQQLENMLIQMQQTDDGWQAYINNERVSGEIFVPDDKAKQLVIDLDYLRIPSPEDDEEKSERVDIFAGIDPATLPRLAFRTEELTMNDENAGAWEFSLESDQTGALIRDFRVTMPDASIEGLRDGLPAQMYWRYDDEEHTTDFIGRFLAEDLSEVLPRLGISALVESESSEISGELTWLGSPTFFSLATSTGRLEFRIDDGRFVNIDAGSSRIFGALNLESLVRRLQLDFSDLYQSGLAYDRIEGIVDLTQGLITTDGPINVRGPSTSITLEGMLDLAEGTVDADMLVSVPLGQSISVVAGLLGAWPIAVFSLIFEDEMQQFATIRYELDGSLDQLQAGFSAEESEAENQPVEVEPESTN